VSLHGDGREVALVDLLDRVLATGVVVTGDLTISLAGIDLIRLDLRVLLASVASIDAARGPASIAVDLGEPAIPASADAELRALPVARGESEERP
jgi:hypothetical protein